MELVSAKNYYTLSHIQSILYTTLSLYYTPHSVYTIHHTQSILYTTLSLYYTPHSVYTIHHTQSILYTLVYSSNAPRPNGEKYEL
ncbi:hypothetical protein BMR1_03g02125 [Babesia microti strain RI]|uniref:Uncharacterized protein n=1 Tax=Babesia microti (strain RI) TaxID=1133968 RepID=A0A0K3AMT6_BABMR|nr:hypothetical protein BMR1_03g02125 [Babesia microti strain RI]CTQ41024.1 hypothetical protein BMR1_03g02125 [Babesia microti strain RI]|eukprot:XP_012649035.1 hypothetical protein BMR1_03g02125 [Babesia microti strain RI]